MTLTHDESRALMFIAGLLFLSVAVRVASLPEKVGIPGEVMDLEAHIAATAAAVAEAERMAEPLADGETIDPNTAPVTELARLPRVGPALARRIVEDRERNGPFGTAAELARVPGVGERLVELATPFLALPAGGAASARAARPGGGPGPGDQAFPRPDGRPHPGGSMVDLNTAGPAELEALPGVGPVIALRIVAYRDSVGRFGAVDELVAVRGIGEATLARIRGRVWVGP